MDKGHEDRAAVALVDLEHARNLGKPRSLGTSFIEEIDDGDGASRPNGS